MKIGKRFFTCLILALSFSGFVFGQAEDRDLPLTLDDCIARALKNNLDLAVQVLSPELSDIAVQQAREKFIPTLSFSYTDRETNSASYSWLEAAEVSTQLQGNYSAQISQVIPTGGNFTLSLTGSRVDTNSKFQTINPRYNSSLQFTFSQPLLRNFGPRMSRREIIVARNNLDISEKQFQKFVQDMIYEVEQAYWNLVYGIENLKVRQQSLRLARELLEKNRRSVEIGSLAPIDVLSAESDVAAREADILEAEALVKNYEDTLKVVINLEKEDGGSGGVRIVPADSPEAEGKVVDLNSVLVTATENRPDLAVNKIDIQNKEIQLSYARNQLLPDLSLQAQYWSPGVSGDQLLYLNDNPLSGIIIGTIPQGYSQALKDTFGFKYRNFSVALTLSVPLNSIFSKAAYAQARVNLEQSLLNLENQEQKIFLEIRNAVRAVETNYKRVQAYRASRELAARKLEAEEEKLRVGLTTNYFVLQYQRDLTNQQTLEIKAIIDYRLSLARLEQVQGISLKTRNIKIDQMLTD